MMLVAAPDGPTSGTPFVLVVDDDPDIRETLEALLSMHGHPVVAAADGSAPEPVQHCGRSKNHSHR